MINKTKIICLFGLVIYFVTCFTSGFFFYRYSSIKNEYENYRTSVSYLENYHVWYGIFNTTLYTLHQSECSKNKEHRYYGITKSGYRAVRNRTVAVDPKIVRLGSILIDIETGKKYIAEDTGSNVKGFHIDIFIGEGTKENRKKADKYGMQRKLFIVID
ncbi:MAG: 3D domain-containing protein [Elusimicrobiota bacterium]